MAYLLFRVADCIEDHDMLDARTKARLLRLWAGVLTGEAPVDALTAELARLDGSDPEVYVAQHAGSSHGPPAEPSRNAPPYSCPPCP